ncbi:histidinol-phosphate transaminase [Acinetobacter sp. WZC-1]|uniref:histidinol-phosphate transaminase n=1 Tax=Acinetobacter sp. WZC-1 TaxID=3459034 RepID=UPI00403E237E
MLKADNDLTQQLLRPEMLHLPVYDAGADQHMIQAQYQLTSVARLSCNENPLGISPKVAGLLSQKMDLVGCYPDPASRGLCQQLAERFRVQADQVIIGNGSENILELLCLAFLNRNDRVLTQSPCFGLHEIFPLMMGAQVQKITYDSVFQVDLAGWLQALQQPVKMLLISNPSNPVGNIFNHAQLAQIIAAAAQDTLLVIDEAYYEYAIHDADYPDALELLREQKRPWIVLRTFSKAYGLAGLRVGYGIASDHQLIRALHQVRTPYNINCLAQEAAQLVLDDHAHLHRSVLHAETERQYVSTVLNEHGFFVAPSYTNFLFLNTEKNAVDIAHQLNATGVMVKGWRERGYEPFLRMSVGHRHENDRFLEGLLALC